MPKRKHANFTPNQPKKADVGDSYWRQEPFFANSLKISSLSKRYQSLWVDEKSWKSPKSKEDLTTLGFDDSDINTLIHLSRTEEVQMNTAVGERALEVLSFLIESDVGFVLFVLFGSFGFVFCFLRGFS